MATNTKADAIRVSHAVLNESDLRCVRFSRIVVDHGFDPVNLARLCALSRRAFSAGERACNVPNYTGDKAARQRVEAQATEMLLRVEWNGLGPSFYSAQSHLVDVPY